MRVAFLTRDPEPPHVIGFLSDCATRLTTDHGFDVTIVEAGSTERQKERRPSGTPSRATALDHAREMTYDVAVSMGPSSAGALREIPAARYASWVAVPDDASRVAMSAGAQPVRLITNARWVANVIDGLDAGAPAIYVRDGIAKDLFTVEDPPQPVARGPLRILVDGDAAEEQALEATLRTLAAMREDRHVTVMTVDSSSPRPPADRLVHRSSPRVAAALYADSHVVVDLSRAGEVAGAVVEGLHMGATCVVTPLAGAFDYVRHRHDGLIVGWGDLHGTAQALDLLARDPALLHRLRCNALVTSRTWPSWEQQSSVMAAALCAIRREPPPPPAEARRRLIRDTGAALDAAQRRVARYDLALDQIQTEQVSRAFRYARRGRTALRAARRPGRVLRRRLGR